MAATRDSGGRTVVGRGRKVFVVVTAGLLLIGACTPTTPTDPGGTTTTTTSSSTTTTTIPTTPPHVRGDLNGDGKADVLTVANMGDSSAHFWAQLSDGGSLSNPLAWSTPSLFTYSNSYGFPGDFNGDGRADAMTVENLGSGSVRFDFQRNDASSFAAPSGWSVAGFTYQDSYSMAEDFNGDGKDDVLTVARSGDSAAHFWVQFSDGGSLGSPIQWSAPSLFTYNGSYSFPGDFDGDGLSDVMTVEPLPSGSVRLDFQRNNHTSFAAPTGWSVAGYSYDDSYSMPGDFDGDGKDDVLTVSRAGDPPAHFWVQRSNGGSLGDPEAWSAPSLFTYANSYSFPGDFDGDGLADVMTAENLGSGSVRFDFQRNNRTSFAEPTGWSVAGFTYGDSYSFGAQPYQRPGVPRPGEFPPPPSGGPGDLPAPSWWSGSCDDGHYFAVAHQHSYPLAASYRGVKVCGPRPFFDGAPDVTWTHGGWGEYEWECTELVFRYMYLADGITNAWQANGNTVYANYNSSYGGGLIKIANGSGTPPVPGDVISFGATAANSAGHVAVVESTSVNASGNGSIRLISQNDTTTGWRTLAVSGGTVSTAGTGLGAAIGWLHKP